MLALLSYIYRLASGRIARLLGTKKLIAYLEVIGNIVLTAPGRTEEALGLIVGAGCCAVGGRRLGVVIDGLLLGCPLVLGRRGHFGGWLFGRTVDGRPLESICVVVDDGEVLEVEVEVLVGCLIAKSGEST
jgi:hypothetical protein